MKIALIEGEKIVEMGKTEVAKHQFTWCEQFLEWLKAIAVTDPEVTEYMNYLAGCMNAYHSAKRSSIPPPPPQWWEYWSEQAKLGRNAWCETCRAYVPQIQGECANCVGRERIKAAMPPPKKKKNPQRRLF